MIQIRAAQPGDRDTLRLLVQDIKVHYFGAPLPDAEVEYALDDMLERREVHVQVAIDGAEMVGFATYTILQVAPNGYGTLFLKDLYIAASSRGCRASDAGCWEALRGSRQSGDARGSTGPPRRTIPARWRCTNVSARARSRTRYTIG